MKLSRIALPIWAVLISATSFAEDRWDSVAEKTDFACANEIAHVLPFLGRGEIFPKFLIMDLEFTLDQQIAGSRLKELHCMGSPSLETTPKQADVDDLVQDVTVTFPVEFIVENAMKRDKLVADLVYKAKDVNAEDVGKVSFSMQIK